MSSGRSRGRSLARITAPALALAVAASGCALDPLEKGCPPWTRAGEGGAACAPRIFVTPAASDAVGEPGGRDIDLAVDALGRGIAAWSLTTASTSRAIVAEELTPGAWEIREPSAGLPGLADMFDIAIEPDGAAIVAFRQYVKEEGSVLLSRRDASGAWSDPGDLAARISFAPTAYEPRMAVHPSGEVLLVWNQWMSTGYGVALARRAPGSEAWQRPADPDDVLSPKILFSNAPQITVSPAGHALVTWYQSGGGPLMVRASERFGPEGAFSRPSVDEILSAPGGAVDSHPVANPVPAIGPDGEAVIAWTQENTGGAIPVYLAARDRDRAWTKPSDLKDTFSRPEGEARCPQVAFDKEGELYVAWYEEKDGEHRAYAARRAKTGEWIDPGSSPFELSSEGARGITPMLAVGADGSVLAAWAESVDGGWRVAARRTSAGAPWGPVEILSPELPGFVSGLAVAAGGPQGRMVVAWTQGKLGEERA